MDRFKHDYQGVGGLLASPEMRDLIARVTEGVAASAGSRHVSVDARAGRSRARGYISAPVALETRDALLSRMLGSHAR